MLKKEKKIIFNGNKESLRNYIFVKDAANFISNVLKIKQYGVFYVGGEIISFEKMLKHICKKFDNKKNLFFNKEK